MYVQRIKILNMQESRVEHNVGVSHAEKLTYTHKSMAHKLQVILFFSLLHTPVHTNTHTHDI